MDEYSSNNQEDFILMLLVGIFLLEIVVGAIQLLGALIRTVILINRQQSIGKLKTYWIMVLSYFSVFFGLYFAEGHILNYMSYSSLGYQLYVYFLYTHVIWIILAWGIAIWYCIKIVFVKRIKSVTLIN